MTQSGSMAFLNDLSKSSLSQNVAALPRGQSDGALKARYMTVLKTGALDELRKLVLFSGMPNDANELGATPVAARCSLRGLVWKALLGIGRMDPAEYPALVRNGPSADDHRVREDARRTFSKSDDFCMRVPNAKIIRLLNAYVHATGNKRGVYAQSMSLLAAPLLYVMPEPEAFHCFRVFLTSHVPLYVKQYIGARRGCQLLDRCLADVDPELHELFASHHLHAEVYAFPTISSLGACVPPMSDTVRLWDIQLAFGCHMHVVFTLARLLLASPRICAVSKESRAAPLITRELEQGLGLDSETVLARAVPLVRQINSDLYIELLDHAYRPVADEHTLINSLPFAPRSLPPQNSVNDDYSDGCSTDSHADDVPDGSPPVAVHFDRPADESDFPTAKLSNSNLPHVDKCTVSPVTLASGPHLPSS